MGGPAGEAAGDRAGGAAGRSRRTTRLLEELARPEAYPRAQPLGVDDVIVLQTHISIVFLAGSRAYKIKKAVRPGFLDFGTLERRRHFCHEEVRLNRRLAAGVYHGVVPVVDGPDGLRFGDLQEDDDRPPDRVFEWAVRMTRLPDERTVKALLRRGGADEALLSRLARRLADFHARAERGPHVSRHADPQAVARNARENFEAMEEDVGWTVSAAVLRRLRTASDRELGRLGPITERRAREHMPCDGHGDLRLGHVYALADGGGEERIVVIDCIEFGERYRHADPVADIAFLAMELEFEGRPGLAASFSRDYLEAAGDREGAALLPWYVAYRDVVRGKVRSLESKDPAVPAEARRRAAGRARRHFMRALVRLAPPRERPCLVLLAGLPGSGKSRLARGLVETGDFAWLDTDRVRKRLAAASVPRLPERQAPPAEEPAPSPAHRAPAEESAPSSARRASFEGGIYTREWTERTYEECLARAERVLLEGGRVVVEGSFRSAGQRARFLDRARELGAPALLILLEADRSVLRRRLGARLDDASDADWQIFEAMERRWEAPGEEVGEALRRLSAGETADDVLRKAHETLEAEGLL